MDKSVMSGLKGLLFFVVFLCKLIDVSAKAHHSIHFAVIGDYGSATLSEKKVSKRLKTLKPEFIITLGDNNYPAGCAETIDDNIGQFYHNYIGNYQGKYGKGAKINRFFPSMGNHDWAALISCPSNKRLPYLDYFSLPGNQRYYDFVKGPVHFYALDSDLNEPDGVSKNSKQYLWLVEKLKNDKSMFKVVYFHHPPYSSGEHGSSQYMQWDFAQLGIDLVLSGHEHDYERIHRNGIAYIVNGMGGTDEIYHETSKVEGSQFFYNNEHGLLIIDANKKQMKVAFITAKGKTIDKISIKAKRQT